MKTKRFLLIFVLFISLFLVSACDVTEMGSLSDLSKPYIGTYECKKILLGGEDVTNTFEYIRLELAQSGDFKLSYRTTEGGGGSYGGQYQMDSEKGELTFSAKTPVRTFRRTFPVKDGTILIDLNFRGRLLHAEFEMP